MNLRRGFSLIEVILAVGVGVMAFVPIIDVLLKSYDLTNRQAEQGLALSLADAALNQARVTPFLTLKDALNATKTMKFSFKFPSETTEETYDIPIHKPDSSQGSEVKPRHTAQSFRLKLEVSQIAAGAGGAVNTLFKYGYCGYKNPGDAAVSSFTRNYLSDEVIVVISATVDFTTKQGAKKVVLTTCRADLGQ